jgi:hypothetical protein
VTKPEIKRTQYTLSFEFHGNVFEKSFTSSSYTFTITSVDDHKGSGYKSSYYIPESVFNSTACIAGCPEIKNMSPDSYGGMIHTTWPDGTGVEKLAQRAQLDKLRAAVVLNRVTDLMREDRVEWNYSTLRQLDDLIDSLAIRADFGYEGERDPRGDMAKNSKWFAPLRVEGVDDPD